MKVHTLRYLSSSLPVPATFVIVCLLALCSSSLDSPCPAGQAGQTGVVGGTIAGDLMTSNAGAASASAHTFPSTQTYWDSDFDTEPDPPDWRLTITTEELRKLRPREQKRQDVINGK